MLHKKNLQPTEFNSILHQQHCKVSRYSGYFIFKKAISSVQHFHKWSTLLQVDYLQITQQAQPIYSPHSVYLHKHIIWIYNLQQNTYYFPPTSPTSYYLKQYDLDNIHSEMKAMTNKHHSGIKFVNKQITDMRDGINDHISSMLEKPSNTSSKTDNQEEEITYLSYKLSNY